MSWQGRGWTERQPEPLCLTRASRGAARGGLAPGREGRSVRGASERHPWAKGTWEVCPNPRLPEWPTWAIPGGLTLHLLLFLGEIFALPYSPTDQIELLKNVNQTKSSLFLKQDAQGKWHHVWNEL